MDVKASSIVVTGQLVVRDLVADGLQDCPEAAWLELQDELAPCGFSWEAGKLRIPGDLVSWWRDVLAGRPATWPRDPTQAGSDEGESP